MIRSVTAVVPRAPSSRMINTMRAAAHGEERVTPLLEGLLARLRCAQGKKQGQPQEKKQEPGRAYHRRGCRSSLEATCQTGVVSTSAAALM
jgi:hypothetical protein